MKKMTLVVLLLAMLLSVWTGTALAAEPEAEDSPTWIAALGEEQEAQIEGGEAEARKKNPDKYILESERRIDDPSEVNDVLGFTEEVDSIEVEPQEVGAVGVTLINPSRHVTVTYDTTDGLKAKYTYKTKDATDSNGKLTDITFQKKVSNASYSEVTSTTGKNPKNEGWYIKNGNVYIPSLDTTPQTGVTYYSRG